MKELKLNKKEQGRLDEAVTKYKSLRTALCIISEAAGHSEIQMWRICKELSEGQEVRLDHEGSKTKIFLTS